MAGIPTPAMGAYPRECVEEAMMQGRFKQPFGVVEKQ
jgi:hypothetical protein